MIAPTRPLVAVVLVADEARDDLGSCLDSIVSQTHPNWVCLVADSGARESRADLLAAFAQREPRIRVLHNATLNSALRAIPRDADYCKIVTANALLYPQCIERLVAAAEAAPRVAVVSAFALENDYVRHDGLPYPSAAVPGRDVARLSLLNRASVFGSPTSVLWRASVIRARDPFYHGTGSPAHWEACYELLKEWDFGFVHQVLTATRLDGAALASQHHENAVGRLVCLDRFASTYLTADDAPELAALSARMWRDYYDVLGRSLLQRKGASFWSYHRAELGRIKHDLRPLRLAWSAMRSLADLLRHPAELPSAVRRRFLATRA